MSTGNRPRKADMRAGPPKEEESLKILFPKHIEYSDILYIHLFLGGWLENILILYIIMCPHFSDRRRVHVASNQSF